MLTKLRMKIPLININKLKLYSFLFLLFLLQPYVKKQPLPVHFLANSATLLTNLAIYAADISLYLSVTFAFLLFLFFMNFHYIKQASLLFFVLTYLCFRLIY
jgi:hypothetical protein